MLSQRRNLTYQLVHELGTAILSSEYKSGDRLPTEAHISEKFQISRTATREAIKILSAKGLIQTKARNGITVQALEKWNLFDSDVLNWILLGKPDLYMLRSFLQLRSGIEPQAAFIAAEQAKTDNLMAIENALKRMKNGQTSDEATLAADIDFHKSILAATNNPFFVQLSNFVVITLKVNMRFTDRITAVTNIEYQAHADIYTHIKNKESQAAYDAAIKPLKATMDIVNAKINAL